MQYNEWPIDTTGMVCQVANPKCNIVNTFAADGTRKPKENDAGEYQYEVELMIMSPTARKMTLEKCKVYAQSNPCENMNPGQPVTLTDALIYTGIGNDGRKFFGLKAAEIKQRTAAK